MSSVLLVNAEFFDGALKPILIFVVSHFRATTNMRTGAIYKKRASARSRLHM